MRAIRREHGPGEPIAAARGGRLVAAVMAIFLLGLTPARGARAAAETAAPPCAALAAPESALRVAVWIEPPPGGPQLSKIEAEVWEALGAALAATPVPRGVSVDLAPTAPPSGAAVLRLRGGVLQLGALKVLDVSVALDPGDERPDLSANLQDRTFTGRMSRDWLTLPATVIDEGRIAAARAGNKAAAAAGWSNSVGFLQGAIAYLAHRRLPAGCAAEGEQLKEFAIRALRRWDGPRQEEVAAEASAVAKQLRAFLEFADDSCEAYDGGEDSVRLLVAAARLAPQKPEARRLAVIAQLHRSYHPPTLCGAALERDLLASVALAPGDDATLRDAGVAYDLLAQGAPRAFAPGQEVDRVEAFRQMRRVPSAYRPAVRGTIELGAGPVVSLAGSRMVGAGSRALAFGGRLELWIGPTVIPVTLRVAAESSTSREITFSDRDITASWRRDAASIGLGYRLTRRGLFVDIFADAGLGRVHIQGNGIGTAGSTAGKGDTVAIDAGPGGGVRVGWSWRYLALSAEAVGAFWTITQFAKVEGLEEHALPRGDFSGAIVLSFSSGIQVRR